MSTIAVELPRDLQDFLEATVRQGRFSNVSEYIVALVDAARKKRSEIEAALIDGLQSGPAEEWTSDEWQEIRQRVIARHQLQPLSVNKISHSRNSCANN